MLFKKKPKFGVALFIALSMLLQLSGPLLELAYAENQLPNEFFKVEEVSVEGENASVDWNLVIDSNSEMRDFTYQFDFELENEIESSDLKTNDGLLIGAYAVTRSGNMSVVLYEDFLDSNTILGNTETNSNQVVDEAPAALQEVNANTELVFYDIKGKILISGVVQEVVIEDTNRNDNTILIESTQSEEAKNLGNIFTDVAITLGEGENLEEIPDNSTIQIVDGMILNIKFNWVLNNIVSLSEGDYSIINLPSGITLLRDESGNLLDEDEEEVVGTYHLNKESRTLKVVFNDELVDKYDRHGEVWVAFNFDLSKFEEDTTQTIKFETNEEKDFTIRLKPLKGSSITKEGVADKPLSANNITWTIDVNTSLNTINNAKIADQMLDGLELESIEVYNLVVGYNGKLTLGSKVSGLTEFPVNLGNINSAYRIIYITTIKDSTKSPFTNVAVLTGDEVKQSAENTVVTRSGSSIDKFDGVPDKNTNSKNISWKIHVNSVQASINDAIVEDVLKPGLSLDESSLEVYNLSIKDDGTSERGSKIASPVYTYDEDSKKIRVMLGDINKAYEIVYSTDIDYDEVSVDYGVGYVFNNTATLVGTEVDSLKEYGEDVSTATVKRGEIITKSGENESSTSLKKIDWVIKVNETEDTVYDIWVEDKSGPGIEYIDGSVKVYDNLNNRLKEGTHYTVEKPGDDRKDGKGVYDFKVILNGKISSSYTVKYSTRIEDDKYDQTNFTNAARISWIPKEYGTGDGGLGSGEPGSGDPNKRIYKEIESGATATIKNSYSKGKSEVNYVDKTMGWKINLNFYKGITSDVVITDTFPNNGLVFLEDTLIIKHKVNGVDTTLKRGTDNDFTVSKIDDSYGKGFKIKFNGKYENSNIYITYKTSFDPDYLGYLQLSKENPKDYVNKAEIAGNTSYNGETKPIITEPKFAKRILNQETVNNGKKIGKLNREKREISWDVYVNYMAKDLRRNEFVVKDTLGEGQKFDSNSLKVSPYELNVDGSFGGIGEPISADKYVLESNEDESGFVLKFIDGIKIPYVIQFQSKIEGISKAKYTNVAEVENGIQLDAEVPYPNYNDFLFKEATNVESKVWIDDIIDWKIRVNGSLSDLSNATLVDNISAGLVYVKDSLKIKNLEDEVIDSSKYEFSSETLNGETKLTIKFKEGIKETYIITYSTVVVTKTGTVINKASFSGDTISVTNGDGVKIVVGQSSGGTGTGRDKKGAIFIEKLDENEIPITAIAEFEIYYMLNGEKRLVGDQTYKTDNGKIKIFDLAFREYFILEKTSPQGFEIEVNSKPISIIVKRATGENNQGAYIEKIKNTHTKIDVTGNKVWEGGPSPKPAIELQLFRDNVEYKEPVILEEETEYTWEALDRTNNAGRDYVYEIKELSILDNYTKAEEGLTVTNTYVSPLIDVTGKKVWVRGPEVKPTIELQLYRNGEPLEGTEIASLKNGETEHTWEGLDKTDFDGVDYVYTVREVNTPRNYRKSEQGLTVTNTFISPETDVRATKVWVNGPEVRPAIELQLYRNGQLIGGPVTLENGETEYVWANMDTSDSSGNLYTYTVKEVNVPKNYTRKENGLTVTNTYVIPKVDITGTKLWIGGPDVKPTIKLQLFKDGEVFGEVVTLESGVTTHTWTDLDLTNSKGLEYIYTIDEVEVPTGYKKAISENGLTITNTFVSPIRGQLLISKVDSQTEEVLEGAIFELRNEDGTVINTLTTDADGKVAAQDLAAGKYILSEIKAPNGYLLDEGITHEFSIVEDNQLVSLTIENEKGPLPNTGGKPSLPDTEGESADLTPGKPTLPATGTSSNIPFYLLGISLVAIGSVALLRKRKLNS